MISKALHFLIHLADEVSLTKKERHEHGFIIYIGLTMSVGGLIWGTLCAYWGLNFQSLFPYAYVVLTALNFTYLYFFKHFKTTQFIQILISLLIPFLFQLSMGGFVASGAVILWSMLTILVSFTFLERRSTALWFLLYLVLVILSGILDKQAQIFNPSLSPNLSTLFFTLNIFCVSLIIMLLVYYYANSEKNLRKNLQDKANTDSLTRLSNRRHFFKKSDDFFSETAADNLSFIILMLDIDYFKSVNDNFGHDVGDKALVIFAQLLKEHARKTDIMGRYGGEEFIMLLPNVTLTQAQAYAQRIINFTRDICIKTDQGDCQFTVSIGISSLKTEDQFINDVIKRSDEALYAAKNAGRNNYYVL